RRVCSSDAVVLGLIESRRTMLTADENSLFTDYQVSVIEAVALVPSATRIIATHGGGEAIVGGQLTRDFASDDDLPKLQLRQRYLLVLRSITNLWQDGVYELTGRGPNGDTFPETEYPRAVSIRANCGRSIR
ncbi:MAG TPA: hypothetical protein VJP86_11750, partial [Vicinamibacterales bacterium]|nr:hypothetical protein [Vicinamibacterales bacterium]